MNKSKIALQPSAIESVRFYSVGAFEMAKRKRICMSNLSNESHRARYRFIEIKLYTKKNERERERAYVHIQTKPATGNKRQKIAINVYCYCEYNFVVD